MPLGDRDFRFQSRHQSGQSECAILARSAPSPMVWQDRAIGVLNVSRESHARFTDKELALLKTFADQAVQ